MSDSTETTTAARLRTLMAEVFEVPSAEITPDLTFGDLPQWDSLGHMDLMMRLEETFGIEMDTDLIAELVSFPAICQHLETNGHGG